MSDLGFLKKHGQQYEFHYPEHGLVVRGAYAEWVLQAAAELIAQTELIRADGHLEELTMLEEMGEADSIEIDSAKYDRNSRFEVLPQCVVTMGSLDYRWTADAKAPEREGWPAQRVHDMSQTRHDSFLKNDDGVDTTKQP
jgi:hypothetical protein